MMYIAGLDEYICTDLQFVIEDVINKRIKVITIEGNHRKGDSKDDVKSGSSTGAHINEDKSQDVEIGKYKCKEDLYYSNLNKQQTQWINVEKRLPS